MWTKRVTVTVFVQSNDSICYEASAKKSDAYKKNVKRILFVLMVFAHLFVASANNRSGDWTSVGRLALGNYNNKSKALCSIHAFTQQCRCHRDRRRR